MSIVKIENLTKKYKTGYGIFDINIQVEEGEVYGYLGPNGSGKSTTIRHIMGYIKPQIGTATIFGHDAWKSTHLIQPMVGYVPGEIVFPENANGLDFLKEIFTLRKQDNWDFVEQLIAYWEFNPNIKIKKMSKGMKQKLALVLAFMHKPKLLILDEPTNGLDPLMQEKFIDLILQIKQKGTTIIMSSHVFSEIEKTCDRVGIIKGGRIISDFNLHTLINESDRKFEIRFSGSKELNKFKTGTQDGKSIYTVPSNMIETFFDQLKTYTIKTFKEISFSLEEHFLRFYHQEENFNHQEGGATNV